MISDQNRRRIFFLCKRMGLDAETRHLIQYGATGRESLKDMNDQDAWRLIHALKAELRKRGAPRRGIWKNHLPKGDNVVNLMTAEQRAKIKAMSMRIYGSFDENSMNKFCGRQFAKQFNHLTADEAIRLIEIQKSILDRKEVR
ncbi:MAG TPA: DUF1018 domain-containing protein [Spirochaetota bacterium]|nr:DUF1018 domain-containing protein [Spirochaetota bacterium]HRZ28713.1 DUF1018 domain-containing protein [Spirochaetota bacterium]